MTSDTGHNDQFSNERDTPMSGFRSGIIKKTEYFDLFISYKRDNGDDHGQKLAERLYRELSAQGLKVWLDNEEIGFSRDFEVRIEEAILHSKKFACVLSPAWLDSENCRFEYLKALEFEKRIIPIHYKGFRDKLRSQKDQGILTEEQWRRLDKPQEFNFSQESYYQSTFNDLISVCNLKDEVTSEHTKILCESYYWTRFSKPQGVLLRGIQLTKTRRLKKICDGDEESPSFVALQDEFLSASEKFVTTEVSRKRTVFLSFSPETYELAAAIDLELRLQNVSTWFDDFENEASEQSDFIEAILNSETVVHLARSVDEEDNFKLAFARSNEKRILKVTSSNDDFEKLRAKGNKNAFYWEEGKSLEALVTSIKGDAAYVSMHAKLLEEAYQWEKSGKNNDRLLPLREAHEKQGWYQAAEAQGSEPKPSLLMVDYVERSVIHGEGLLKRKRMALWTSILGIALLIFLGIGVFNANKQKNEAVDQEIATNKKAYLAEQKSKMDRYAAELNKRVFSLEFKMKQEELSLLADSMNDMRILQEKERAEAERTIAAARDQVDKLKGDSIRMQRDYALEKLKNEREQELAQSKLRNLNDSILVAKNLLQGHSEAREALHYARFHYSDLAKLHADSSFELLGSANASVQIQTLYEAYEMLVEPTHPLYASANRKNSYTESNLADYFGYNPNSVLSPIQDEESEILLKIKDKGILKDGPRSLYATHTFSQDKSKIAIGTKDGHTYVFGVDSLNRISDTIRYNSHRVTSILLIPGKLEDLTPVHYLISSGIDNKITIQTLDSAYRRIPEIDVIELNTQKERIEELKYQPDNKLIIARHGSNAQAWAIRVEDLKVITENKKK